MRSADTGRRFHLPCNSRKPSSTLSRALLLLLQRRGKLPATEQSRCHEAVTSGTVTSLCMQGPRNGAADNSCCNRAMDDHIHTANFDDHLQLSGLAEQFAGQTDAYLHVEGDYIPVHSAVLAVQSCVFADMFKASDKTAHRRDGKICIPMTGHTFADVCIAVKFLYQRTTSHWENSPCKDIWKDIHTARPILRFAHKFNMKSLLQDCDLCLSEKAQEDHRKDVALDPSDADAALMWAALAEECNLTRLLSHVELFMVKPLTPKSWLSGNPATSQLSSACVFRVLRAAQEYSTASRTALEAHIAAMVRHHDTHRSHISYCSRCNNNHSLAAACSKCPKEP